MTFKTYLINKINSQKFRLNGLVPSRDLPRKQKLRQAFGDHVIYRADQLPPKVDLRSEMTPVEDQSRIGSCAANSLAGAYEYLTKKANGRDTDVSRLFIYYNARMKDQKNERVVDSGCTMTSAIEALEEFGTCLESIWPYDISRVNTRPSEQSYDEAKRHRITDALRLEINLQEMKSCLAQGFPFAFGLQLFSSFDQAARTGVVPMPNYWDVNRQSHASHALLAVGYSDQSRAFIVRNSWGEQWGDRGYCYIRYDYLTNPTLCFDVWTIRQIATNDFGRDHWDVSDAVNYSRTNVFPYLGDNNSGSSNGAVIQTIDDRDDDEDNHNNYYWNPSSNPYRKDPYDNTTTDYSTDEDTTTDDNYYYDRSRRAQPDYYSSTFNNPYLQQNNFFSNVHQTTPAYPGYFAPQFYGSSYGYTNAYDPMFYY